MNSYMENETVDVKVDNIQVLRRVSELARDRFESDRDADILRGAVEGALIVSPMREAIRDGLAQVKSRYLVGADDNALTAVVHYTRIQVVVGMFQAHIEGKPSYLRMYDTLHSNDPDEGKYLLERIAPIVREELGDISPCAYVTSFISPKPESEMGDDVDRVRDNLVFWRTYGNDGAGCSLTVRIPAGRLFKVSYGQKDAESAARNIQGVLASVKGALNPVLGIPDEDANVQSIKANLLGRLTSELVASDPTIFYLHKSGAYEYEREVRAIGTVPIIGRDQIEFEYSDDSGEIDVRHYYERDDLCATNLLTSHSVITIGPSVQNRESVAYYLEYLKRKSNLLGPRIVQSQVSYRNN